MSGPNTKKTMASMIPLSLAMCLNASAQTLEYGAMSEFSSGSKEAFVVLKYPGFAYPTNLPGYICSITYSKPGYIGTMKFCLIPSGFSNSDIGALVKQSNKDDTISMTCPPKLLRLLHSLSVSVSLPPSNGLASASVDTDHYFLLSTKYESKVFIETWNINQHRSIKLFTNCLEDSLLKCLTQRSTRTQPLRSSNVP